jgi:hypothetical protein
MSRVSLCEAGRKDIIKSVHTIPYKNWNSSNTPNQSIDLSSDLGSLEHCQVLVDKQPFGLCFLNHELWEHRIAQQGECNVSRTGVWAQGDHLSISIT